MKILHVLASSDIEDGGAVQAVIELAPFLSKKGLEVTIFAPKAGDNKILISRNDGVDTTLFPKAPFAKYWAGYSVSLAEALVEKAAGFDLIHTHGLWYYPQFIAHKAAKYAGIPLITTIHGELCPEGLKRRAFRKAIYSTLIQRRILKKAAAIHALSQKEAEDVKRFVDNQNIFIIPNGVDPERLERPPGGPTIKDIYPQLKDKKIILFMGRINEGTGLDILAQALGMINVKRSDVRLLIAGPDNWGYRTKIEKMLKTVGVLNKAIFTGMLTGDMKNSALKCADIFVRSSYFEGFSIAVLEAVGSGLPVIISHKCSFPEVEEVKCGKIVDTDAEELSAAIIELLDNPQLAKDMGLRGKRLVRARYGLNRVADEMIEMYEKVLALR